MFDQILKQVMAYGFVDMEIVYGDFAHQKANANKNKCLDNEVVIVKKSMKMNMYMMKDSTATYVQI